MTPARAVVLATLLYAAIFFALGVDRYVTFHSGADLGLFTQAIANYAHGMYNTREGWSHFAYHFSPILYLCVPFVLLAHSALALVAIQAVATALVAPALYLIARKRTSDRNAAALACIALLYPPLQGVTFTDFHEIGFAPAAIAWLLWAIDARRFAVAYVLLAVVLAIKEDMAVAMAWLGFVGAVYFAQRRERKALVFCVVALAVSVLTLGIFFEAIVPAAGGGASWRPFWRWSGSFPGTGVNLVVGRFTYLLEAFVPLALLPFRSRVLVLALPGFTELLSSRWAIAYTMGQHYPGAWVPFVLVAFVIAAARVAQRWAYVAPAALCVLTLVVANPLHPLHFLGVPNARDQALNAIIARVPQAASVGSFDEVYAHMGFYPRAQIGLQGNPQYAIADDAYASTAWDGTILPHLDADVANGRYRPIARDDGITLFERRGPGGP
ncbi:MAG TPA: DUF2079 domain-containing protein [Candidatus Acidoferrales bacterium]|nr:DUF2079 domain-containing protein [Candidatus Acidoferrales bacterium]